MRAYDPQGNPIDLPDEQAWAAYSAGKVGFAADQEVPVKDRFGQVQMVRGADLQDAFSAGFTPATEGEFAKADLEATYGTAGQQALTALEGAGRGLTFGISDAIASEIGGKAYREAANARRQINPGTAMGGELTGALAPLLLTSGASSAASAGSLGRAGIAGAREASLLSRGARGAWNVASAPVRAVEGLGGLTERGVANLIGAAPEGAGLLSRAGRAIAPTMARGAVEGAFQGAGMALTEHSLGNTDASAEDLILSGALLGALTGGALKGTGFAAGEAKQAISKKLQGMGMTDGLVDLYAKASGFLSGSDAEAIKKLLKDPDFARVAVQDEQKVLHRHVTDMAEAYDLARAKTSEIHQDLYGVGKADAVRKYVPAANTEAIRNEAMKLVDDLHAVHKELLSEPAIYTNRKKVKEFGELVGHIETKVLDAEGKHAGADIFLAIDEAKKKLGSYAKHDGMPGIETATADRLAQAYKEIHQPFLEREDIFGMAGLAQKETNALTSPSFTSGKTIGQKYDVKGVDRDPAHDWMTAREMDRGRLTETLQGVGTPGGEQQLRWLRKDAEYKLQAAEAWKKYWGTNPATAKSLDTIVEAQRKYLASLDAAVSEIGAVKLYKGLQSGGSGGMATAVAGALLGGLPGYGVVTAVKKGVDVLADPKSTIRHLVQLKEASRLLDTEFAKKAIGAIKTAGERAAGAAPTAAARLWGSSHQDRQKGYEKTRQAVLAAASDPSRASQAVAGIRAAAPETAAKAEALINRQAQYLASKLPEKPTRTIGRTPKPSDAELAKFARTLEGVTAPARVLEDLQRGSINKEGLEAMREFYPNRFKQVQQAVMTHVQQQTEKGKPIGYEARIKLSALLGTPVDASYSPEFVASMQASYGGSPMPGGPVTPTPRTTRPGAAGRLQVDRYTSNADSLEEGIG